MKLIKILESVKSHDKYKAKIAKKMNLSVDDLEKMSDTEIKTILKDVGKHDFKPDSDFCPDELKAGIKVELEHTNSRLIAKLITKDHLTELSDYYSKLKKMEKE